MVLVAQCIGVAVWLQATGRFQPQVVNDTAGYVAFPWHDWNDALGYYRTPGFPALLQAVGWIAPDWRALPPASYVLYCTAVMVFFAGGCRLTGRAAVMCAAASVLLYSRILHGYLGTIATDVPAAAAGIAVCGLVLWRLSGGGYWVVLVLALAITAGWMLRPAYLFLVPLPAALAWTLHNARSDAAISRRWASGGSMLLVGVAPLLAYAALRWSVVGEFGVVSFGGYNLVGISGQFLMPEDVERLDDELQPVAQSALARRSDSAAPMTEFDDEPKLHYLRVENRYDPTIWYEFEPAARQQAGEDYEQINRLLRNMGTASLKLHPRDYVIWLAKATRQAAKKVLWDFADNPVSLALLLVALGLVCRPRFIPRNSDSLRIPEPDAGTIRVLLVVATLYVVLNLCVVIPVCPPLGRMTDAAAVLLAAPLAAWIAASLRPARDVPT